MRKLKWLKRKKTAREWPYEPPILLGNKSNGEFFHAQTPLERRMRAEILRQCDDKARRLNMDRREFIASAMGMCTSLSVLNLAAGCGDKRGHMSMAMAENNMAGRAAVGGASGAAMTPQAGTTAMPVPVSPIAGGGGSGGMTGARPVTPPSSEPDAGMMDGQCADWCASSGRPDGGFCIPQEATLDCDLAERLLGGEEFIFDLQTHHEFRDQYGYPELTPQIKAGIFGLNAARLYCVDPSACRYQIDQNLLAVRKREYDGELGPRRWAFEQPAIRTRREFPLAAAADEGPRRARLSRRANATSMTSSNVAADARVGLAAPAYATAQSAVPVCTRSLRRHGCRVGSCAHRPARARKAYVACSTTSIAPEGSRDSALQPASVGTKSGAPRFWMPTSKPSASKIGEPELP